MKTGEILSVISLVSLGLCAAIRLLKSYIIKDRKKKDECDMVCGILVFLAVVLITVSQVVENEGFNIQDGDIARGKNYDNFRDCCNECAQSDLKPGCCLRRGAEISCINSFTSPDPKTYCKGLDGGWWCPNNQ